MADGRHFEYKKLQYLYNRLSDFDERLHGYEYLTSGRKWLLKNSNFKNSKIA